MLGTVCIQAHIRKRPCQRGKKNRVWVAGVPLRNMWSLWRNSKPWFGRLSLQICRGETPWAVRWDGEQSWKASLWNADRRYGDPKTIAVQFWCSVASRHDGRVIFDIDFEFSGLMAWPRYSTKYLTSVQLLISNVATASPRTVKISSTCWM